MEGHVQAVGPGGGSDAEVLADVDGPDKEILLERSAEVLKAWNIWLSALYVSNRSITKNSHRLRRLSRASLRGAAHDRAGGRRARANLPAAISSESDVIAGTPHRAYGAKRYARRTHGKRWRWRASTSGNPSAETKTPK